MKFCKLQIFIAMHNNCTISFRSNFSTWELVLIIEIMDNPQSRSKYILPSYPTTFQLLCFFKFTL